MSGGPATVDRWLVLAVLALAAAFVLTVLAWLAVGREMLELMVQVQVMERLLRASPERSSVGPHSAEMELASRAGSPGRVDLRGGSIEMEVLATAYSPEDPGVGNITRSGIPVDRGVVAVDPDVIPLGSYEVWAYLSDGSCREIGYEIPGATYPDWEDTLEAWEKALEEREDEGEEG